MMLTFHDLQVQYVPAVSLVRFQFFRPPGEIARFRESMNAVAQLADQNSTAEGLIDLHGLPSMGLDEQFWLATHWLPRVSTPSVQHVAFIMPVGSLYNQMVIESLHRAAQHFIGYEVQFFSETVSALDWLLSFQNPAAQAAIEQEWADHFIGAPPTK